MKQPLSSPVKKLAKAELNEVEEVKTEALKQMLQWLDERPHISCRRDPSFLLRFLRSRKYRMSEARDQLVKYIKMRGENPKWFKNLDVQDPGLLDLIDGGYYFALPERDRAGRRVLFNRTAALDPSRHSSSDQMRAMLLCFESLLEDEENQIRGFTYILDEKDVGFAYLNMWTISEVTKAIHCCEKTIPIRHKEVNLLNLSSICGAILDFVKNLVSAKISARMKIHASLESLHDVIDPKILPQEYGGALPMATMIAMYKEEISAVRSSVLALDDMVVGDKTSIKDVVVGDKTSTKDVAGGGKTPIKDVAGGDKTSIKDRSRGGKAATKDETVDDKTPTKKEAEGGMASAKDRSGSGKAPSKLQRTLGKVTRRKLDID